MSLYTGMPRRTAKPSPQNCAGVARLRHQQPSIFHVERRGGKNNCSRHSQVFALAIAASRLQHTAAARTTSYASHESPWIILSAYAPCPAVACRRTDRWTACKPGFFLLVRVLSRLFRRLFLEGVTALRSANRFYFFRDHAPLSQKAASTPRSHRCGAPSGSSTPFRRTLSRARLSRTLHPPPRNLELAAHRRRRGRQDWGAPSMKRLATRRAQ
jgi:hypothetical protein